MSRRPLGILALSSAPYTQANSFYETNLLAGTPVNIVIASDSVSVIVPTVGTRPTIRETVLSLLQQPVKEILIVSLKPTVTNFLPRNSSLRVVVADGSVSDARNLGVSESTGEIVAFTDDDCVVDSQWVTAAIGLFADERVAVVGGPGITPEAVSFREKCAGAALASAIGTFSSATRYSRRGAIREAGEANLSTCNLFFRRSALQSAGYFDSSIHPCEENELIWRIRGRGFKAIYTPNSVVFHERRPILRAFLNQISIYGKGRASLARKYPKSLRFVTIAPSLLFLATCSLPLLSISHSPILLAIVGTESIYGIITFVASTWSAFRNGLGILSGPVVWFTLVLMHLCYGARFLIALLTGR
jgi:GT2 family glycosyltransferase